MGIEHTGQTQNLNKEMMGEQRNKYSQRAEYYKQALSPVTSVAVHRGHFLTERLTDWITKTLFSYVISRRLILDIKTQIG